MKQLIHYAFSILITLPTIILSDINGTDSTNLWGYAQSERIAGNMQNTIAAYDKILSENPLHITALYNKAHALKEWNRHEDALPIYEKILTIDAAMQAAQLGLAQCHLALGNFTQGLPGLAARHPDIKFFEQYRWLTASLEGTKILIRAEWGFGDMIQYIRYAELLKDRGAYVIVQSYKELVPLLKQCPYIDYVISDGDEFPYDALQVPLLSLPEIFSTTRSTIPSKVPYLFPDPSRSSFWQEYLKCEHRFKIGICCSGRGDPLAPPHVKKDIPLTTLAPLTCLENVIVYNLQYQQEGTLPGMHVFKTEIDTHHGRFMDTAAIIEHLDLVITVDTSVAHLAGALGKPVWLLLPYTADWRWMKHCAWSPWYPTMKLFRQSTPGNWHEVIETVINELKPRIAVHTSYMQDLNTASLHDIFTRGYKAIQHADLSYGQKLYEHIHEKIPTSASTLHNLGYCLRWQGLVDQALSCYQKELMLTDREDAWFSYAQTLLLNENLADGFAALEKGRASITKAISVLPATIDELHGKTVAILGEWGFGDMFQFIRYAKLLHEHNVTIMVRAPAALKQLLSLCPYLQHVIAPGESLPQQPDYFIPLLSLAHLCDTTIDTIPKNIPYLFANPTHIQQWKSFFDNTPTLRIGLCWQGSTHQAFPDKNIPLNLFKPLLKLPNIHWYSLQKIDADSAEALLLDTMNIKTFGKAFDTDHGAFVDTAAIMHHLDLVITIDTSIAHLAGGLGVPVWVLLPKVPDWRWMLNRNNSPWYPSMRLFRQAQHGEWIPVLEQVYYALKEICVDLEI